MKRMSRICCTLALLLSSLSAVPTAHAALKARSTTIDPATGYPTWYQDTNNLALTNCLDQNGFCLLPGAFTFPANKANINSTNFPDESFFYMADTSGASPGGVINVIVWEAALEAGFASAVVDGGQAVFTRIRYRINVNVPGTYVVTHPYGEETYTIAAGDITPGNTTPEINFTNDVPGLVPQDFNSAVTPPAGFTGPFVGPTFLTRADGTFVTDIATGNRYIGQPGAPVAVTGSPTGNNFVRIVGGGDTFLSTTFGLQGKVIGIDVAPKTSLDLGKVTIPATSAPQTVTVTNTTGNPITFPALATLGGVDAPDFAVAAPAAAGAANCLTDTIPASGSCSFDVTFTPTAAAKAARAATILLAPTTVQPAPAVDPPLSDPPPVTIKLSGTAQYPLTVTVASANVAIPGNIGTGTVTSSIAGIASCSATGGVCTASFDAGSTVALTPTGATNPLSIFHGWTATPAENSCAGTAPCTVPMDGAKSVTADFIQIYNITTSTTPTAGGTISASGVVEHGNGQTLVITPTVTPTTRYRFLALTDNTNPVTPVLEPGTNSFIFSLENVIANHTVAASFIQQFILTPGVTGAGGAITPATPVTLDDGTSNSFTVTPDAGYRIGPVLVDNVAQTVTATPFTIPFNSVKADHSVSASFVKIWNVTSSAGANGSVDKFETVVLDEGSTPSYTFTPARKFQVGKILLDNEPKTFTKPATLAGAVTFTLPAVTADKTVTATFVPSGDLDSNGVVEVNDALKAMKILLNIQTPDADDLAAMKVSPLDAVTGLPSGSGAPNLSDVILILKRAVNSVTW